MSSSETTTSKVSHRTWFAAFQSRYFRPSNINKTTTWFIATSSPRTSSWNNKINPASKSLIMAAPVSWAREFTPISSQDSTERLKSYSEYPTQRLLTCGHSEQSSLNFIPGFHSSLEKVRLNSWPILWSSMMCQQGRFWKSRREDICFSTKMMSLFCNQTHVVKLDNQLPKNWKKS